MTRPKPKLYSELSVLLARMLSHPVRLVDWHFHAQMVAGELIWRCLTWPCSNYWTSIPHLVSCWGLNLDVSFSPSGKFRNFENNTKFRENFFVFLCCLSKLNGKKRLRITHNSWRYRIKNSGWMLYALILNLYGFRFLEFECQFEGLSRSISVFHVIFMYFNGIFVAASWHVPSENGPKSLELWNFWKSIDLHHQSELEVNWY